MKNKKNKSKLVLLNIDAFGIEENINSKSNLYKFIPLENWKKLVNFKNSSKKIEYRRRDEFYQNEFFDVFGFKNNINNKTFVDFTDQYQQIYKAIINNVNNSHINKVYLFLYIDNDFTQIYLPIFINFLSQINLFLSKNKFMVQENNFFYLNLIIEKPLNNLEHFDHKINSLLKENFNCIINSITTKNGFTDEMYIKGQIENYFNKTVLQKKTNVFYSVNDFIYEKSIQVAAEDVVTSADSSFYNKIQDKDLIIYFNFDKNTLNMLSNDFQELFTKNKLDVVNVSLRFNLQNTILNNFENNISKLINKEQHSTIVLGENNISLLNKIFFGNSDLDVFDYILFDNAYQYIYENAKLFYEKIEQNLETKNLILANWNILQNSWKYFDFYECLYALSVFDFFIYKIINLLNKNKIRWIVFSSSFGFERSFELENDSKITMPFLSNKFYSNIKEHPQSYWEDFRENIFEQIKSTNALSLNNKKTKKVRLEKNLFVQQKQLSLIKNNEDFTQFIQNTIPKMNVTNYKMYLDSEHKIDCIQNTFKFQIVPWDQIAEVSSKRINIFSITASMYIEEKLIITEKFVDKETLIYKLIMFFYQKNRIIKSLNISKKIQKANKKNRYSLEVSNAANQSFIFDIYLNHLNTVQEIIDINSQEKQKNVLNWDFFKTNFYKVQKELKIFELINFNKFNREKMKWNQAIKIKNKQDGLLAQRIKKWEELFNKFNESENKHYEQNFDINESIKPTETGENLIQIIGTESNLKTDEDDF